MQAEAYKPCVRCGVLFARHPKYSAKQWAERQFCSRRCSSLTQAEQRPDPRRACRDCGDTAYLSRGRCRSCYSAWRWRNEPEFRAQREAARQRWMAANPGYYNERAKRERQKHNARSAVRDAIVSGRLERLPCEVCGATAEAHHDDYSRPLDVRWLCTDHHGAEHRRIRRAA